LFAEDSYHAALKAGDKPEQAREILPHSIKTEIVVTANLREWRHMFELRTSKNAHPQFRVLMIDCLKGFAKEIPVVFDDLVKQFL
ncbi:MAG: FAD-dependent thymidylate synthase, partial [Gammaproteobacteria bacterium]|nr:FAD-dependent thymidylate synthase [Gammaproteobacteria bacterium]